MVNGHAWKACVRASVPRVRIPSSPPELSGAVIGCLTPKFPSVLNHPTAKSQYTNSYVDWRKIVANSNEAQARIKINRLLEEAGWRFEDSKAGKANINLRQALNTPILGTI